mmetsp:Transcript_15464/g.13502  ORF Transcript_15464/g.13502 Transcript_15464/m.13502 type:complete len:268 (+) Transcript_15464:61-864(+)
MFPFQDRATREEILTNYEFTSGYDNRQDFKQDFNSDLDDEEEAKIDDIREVIEKSGWQKDEEVKLLEYYQIFKDSDDLVIKIAKMLNKEPEAVAELLKEKKLIGQKPKVEKEEVKKPETQSKSKEDKVITQNFVKELVTKKYSHEEIIIYMEHFKTVLSKYLAFENDSEKDTNEMFYQIPLSEDDKNNIYSNLTVQDFIRKLGFIEELGEYAIEIGISKKIINVLKWIEKGMEKIEKIKTKNDKNSIIEEKMAEDLLNGDIDLDQII